MKATKHPKAQGIEGRPTKSQHRSALTALGLASTGLASFALIGCAGGPQAKEDTEAAARAQAYLESIDLVPASAKANDGKACIVPAAAEKVGGGQQAGPSKDWKALVTHANTCVKEKNWKTLETLGNSIARIDIDSPWGAYFMSVAAEGTGDLHRAMWMADLALKKAGGRSGLYSYQKGRVFFAMKETSSAMKEIRGAVALDPRLAEGHLFLAEIHHRDQEFDEAGKYYQAALAVDAKNHKALAGFAEVRLQQGSGAEAADLYTQALSVQPGDLRSWVRLAFVYETVEKNPLLALNTYKGLKSSLDSGKISGRPDFDVNAKIKTLEELAQARVPAQAAAQPAGAAAPEAAKNNEKPDLKTVKK